MMRYCPDCGTPHECAAEQAAERTELAIAKVQADRDIRLAEISARAGVKVAEVTAEHSADFAEGKAEGLETAIGADTADTADTGETAPIIIADADDAEPEPEPEPDSAPPIVDIPEPAAPKAAGWWDGYR